MNAAYSKLTVLVLASVIIFSSGNHWSGDAAELRAATMDDRLGEPIVCVCGDLDGEGTVDMADFATFVMCFERIHPSIDCPADALVCSDLNDNGRIDLVDFATFAVVFGLPATGSPPNCT